MTITRAELAALHSRFCVAAQALMAKKNADYAEDNDVFGNLRLCEQMNLCPMSHGILIRLADKVRRCSSLLRREASTSESLYDTLLDIINYTVLLAASEDLDCVVDTPTTRPENPARVPLADRPNQCYECHKPFYPSDGRPPDTNICDACLSASIARLTKGGGNTVPVCRESPS